MKTLKLKNLTLSSLTLLFYVSGLVFASEESISVLEYKEHPRSPEHTDIYKNDLLSLDARLPWKERFNGNETFNEDHVLPKRETVIVSTASLQSGNEQSMDMMMDGKGVVNSVRLDQGKVKISHEPVEKYGMPKMTMVFRVSNPSILNTIEEGQQVGFNVDNSSGGFVITHIMPVTTMEDDMHKQSDDNVSGEMDARGLVKAVRLSQGKIKIEHGPIEKYGMSGMTMLFKVQDPEMLEGIELDTKIDFDIDVSSGGFEISNIKPVIQGESNQ